ncbi:hypothetical protein DMB66_41085 [Actinoplanes sp. ATCC 53533]|uniref:hypothetical protein n=1 Tax=Actinoplanes sp. ATCC 53533 TaxID=1288362 RepID=UPI000F78A4E3|nr:hypothetical protein [Actinoplanes sp. ATCC 53533]RSM51828.1 hypothetical protein DMB66_41085 [Actinoplanes sp. ATCC 53533]
MTENPLIADRVDAPKSPWAGIWIAEDIELIAQGVQNGSWIDGTLGTVGAGLDGLALVSDPAGAQLQYGIAWLIEHVRPLSEALDWLAGDPAQITAHAETWRNVAGALTGNARSLADAVRVDLDDWSGAAASAYREWAARREQTLHTLARAADTMALITEAAGALIGAVRLLVRDAVATVVSRLIGYAVELIATAGLATPLVVEQVTTLCASWGARIARWLRSLIASLRKLAEAMTRLESAVRQLRPQGRGGAAEPALHRSGDGIVRNGKKILMTMENVEAIAAKFGIDVAGVRIIIAKSRSGGGPGRELYGITTPDGRITLTRDAFVDEEQLARTLAHERFHLEEIRSGLPVPYKPRELRAWEERAYAYERQWWQEHQHLLDGE